ncbi:MAG: hypothetical protein GX444_21620 [Myxococcales bacterium]|nr:hypothetical protein [Myxococcales bacterium]
MDMTEGHRRNISITFQLLDQALCEFRSWAEGREYKSVFYEEVNNLGPERRDALLKEVEYLQARLREVQNALQLEGHAVRATESIRSHATSLWLYLVELGGKYLRGYGDPSPELLAFLDPRVRELLQGVQHIGDIVNKESDATEGVNR